MPRPPRETPRGGGTRGGKQRCEAGGSCGHRGATACYRVGALALPSSPAASRLFLRGGFWMGVFFRGVSGTGAQTAAFSGPGASDARGARAGDAGSTERLAFCGGAGFSRGPCAPGSPSARPRLRVLSRSSAASREAASGALRGGPPASVGSERPGPRPRARARGGEGAATAGPSSASPGGRGITSRARGLPGSSGRADVSLGVRFLLLGLGVASRPEGGGEGARAAAAAPCLPWIQDTLGLVAGSGGGGFLRSGDGERDRPPASPRARAGRASRRATRAYSAPPGPSTLDADRSLSEDAGRGVASSADAGEGASASAGAVGASKSRLSVGASDGAAGGERGGHQLQKGLGPSNIQAQTFAFPLSLPSPPPSLFLPALAGAQWPWHPEMPGALTTVSANRKQQCRAPGRAAEPQPCLVSHPSPTTSPAWGGPPSSNLTLEHLQGDSLSFFRR